MRAAVLEALNTDLVLRDMPQPAPGRGEVLIRVAACGLNFADTLVQKGRYQEKPDLPAVPGMEVAGTVEAVGHGVELAPGARVAAYAGFGGLAEYVVVPAAVCAVLPDAMPWDHAAGFLVAYATSHIALGPLASLQPGERLLVTGAAGGVGLTAVELGKLMGAEVIAQARGADKLAVAKAAGADHLLDAQDDLCAAVKALGGADVVYDAVGGAVFDAALRATNPGARLLPIGFAAGEVPQIPANYLLVKNLTVIGFWVGGYRTLRPALLGQSFATLLGWYAEGKLTPHVSHRLPLEEVNAGLELLRNRAATGKVVIQVSA
ncbi:MAG: NADPH:quinone oxidoreductase family protein [Pseudomonadota bacterium]